MKTVCLEINGGAVTAEVEPRTHLGDFLRDTVRLTGTHLGCEHGVCGACTVLMDGRPVRSCITFAVACQDRCVTTVEGYDGDAVMTRLRAAFTKHHALQCGFCTPGMLATARDIVLRLPDADEARVRLELSGNLCRCTGYVGIVGAIRDVLDQLQREPYAAITAMRETMAAGRPLVPAPAPATAEGAVRPMPVFAVTAPRAAAVAGASAVAGTATGATIAPAPAPLPGAPGAAPGAAAFGAAGAFGVPRAADTPAATGSAAGAAGAAGAAPAPRKGTQVDASFELPFGADAVWAFMGDLPAVAGCLPGASIDTQEGDKVKGRIAVKFGPMSAAFVGAARLERDDERQAAVLRGAGQDSLSQSRAQGDIAYRLERLTDTSTRVHVDMLYSLQGPLAQFSRSGLVKDFVRRMVADFGTQVAHRMAGGTPVSAPKPVSPLAIAWSLFTQRLRRLFGRKD